MPRANARLLHSSGASLRLNADILAAHVAAHFVEISDVRDTVESIKHMGGIVMTDKRELNDIQTNIQNDEQSSIPKLEETIVIT